MKFYAFLFFYAVWEACRVVRTSTCACVCGCVRVCECVRSVGTAGWGYVDKRLKMYIGVGKLTLITSKSSKIN